MGTDAVAPATRARRVLDVLGHAIRDPAVLEQASTHASRCGAQSTSDERRDRANERMEFLGDALLGAALCLLLYRRHPTASEGALSRRKGMLASREALARLFDRFGLADICLVGSQLDQPWPDSVKANLMEGLLGGVFLDGGFDAVLIAVERLYAEELAVPLGIAAEDAKTALQEWSLAHHQCLPAYGCERSGGSDHAPEFIATARVADHEANGFGSSRRRAEAAAAAELLKRLNDSGDS